MENKLEQLLNSLIEKGWKPYGWKNIKKATNEGWFCSFIRDSKKGLGGMSEISHRELVSKESGLWQFVCENGMIKKEGNSEWTIIYPNERTGDYQKCHSYCKLQSEYWVLESALKDESELEDFLLNSIKLD